MKIAEILVGVMVLAMTYSSAKAEEETRESWANMFDTGSSFLQGFETGIFLRTKGGHVEEYGCSLPKSG